MTENSQAEPQRTPRRVLVVDDSRDTATTMAMLVRLYGHEVEIAHDGHAALAKLDEWPPHVAFLDIGLPGMDGYELARRMRQSRPQLYLVAVSGYGQPEDRARSAEAGFNEHFLKPVDPAKLLAIIERMGP